ncbi:MAG: hypothetical protein DRQ35_01415 [Gammaproteobacteria bacterium]|nr:MAG: hypothetical protein DRQ35_01415 [Gammaproteobacteria bacterium]
MNNMNGMVVSLILVAGYLASAVIIAYAISGYSNSSGLVHATFIPPTGSPQFPLVCDFSDKHTCTIDWDQLEDEDYE